MKWLMFLVVFSTASAQLAPVDLPEYGMATTTVRRGKLQVEALSRLGYRSDGRPYVGGFTSGREIEYHGVDVVALWGILDRWDIGIRVSYDAFNIQAFYIDLSDGPTRHYLKSDLSWTSVPLSLITRAGLVNGRGLVPSVALRMTLTLDDYTDDIDFDSSSFVRGDVTLALMNRIGEKSEIGYGIGIAGIGGGSHGSGETGHYWIGVLAPVGRYILAGPGISGEFAAGATGYNPVESRTWFGASARIHPESWPLLHFSGRLCRGFEGEFNYELTLGAAVASFEM